MIILEVHITNYIIGELRTFDTLKDRIEEAEKDELFNTNTLMRMHKNYKAIRKILNSLDEEELKFFDLYFKQGYNRTGVCYRMHFEKNVFYRIKNKIINGVAKELGLS